VAAGAYRRVASAAGFIGDSATVTVTTGTLRSDVVLSPTLAAGGTRIVLTWAGAAPAPSDLDSHLTGPLSAGGRFHVFYSDRGSLTAPPFANLDVDDTFYGGPETVTISQQIAGVYRYAVHNYSAESALSGSGANVKVYRGSALVAEYNVPNQPGTVWTVFELDGTVIRPINSMGSALPAGGQAGVSGDRVGAAGRSARTDAELIRDAARAHPKGGGP
jgi:uncharacterized protein YfaP (DUF2135 family)